VSAADGAQVRVRAMPFARLTRGLEAPVSFRREAVRQPLSIDQTTNPFS
jgi:hypothetical protein